jgi:hypothetical protein
MEADTRQIERELLARYRRERDKALADRNEAQTRFDKYDPAVRALEAVLGETSIISTNAPEPSPRQNGTKPQHGPRGASAIRAVLDEDKDRGWTIRELTEEIARRGWAPEGSNRPEAAVRAAFDRLRKSHPDQYGLIDGRASAVSPASLTLGPGAHDAGTGGP